MRLKTTIAALVFVGFAPLETFAEPPEFTWLNQFAGLPEAFLRNADPTASGLVGSTGSRTQPIKFRAADGSIECHILTRYENGKWSTTGDVETASPGGDNCGFISGSLPVRAVAAYGTDICIGGSFTGLTDNNFNRFACYQQNGNWYTINGAGNEPNNVVEAIEYDGSGWLYVGGSFTTVDGGTTSARRVVRTDGFTWEPLWSDGAETSEGVTGTVFSILPAISRIYVGVGNGVSSWNPTPVTMRWESLGASNTSNPVGDLEFNGSKLAAISPLSTMWGGETAGAISDYDPGSRKWSAVGSSSGLNTAFSKMAIAGGFLHATGNFTAIDPDAKGIARLNRLNEWEPVPDAAALGDFPEFLDLFQMNGDLCGVMQRVGTGQTFYARGIACHDGNKWYGLSQGINGEVRTITRYNSAIVAGGKFSAAGDQFANFIAEYRQGRWQRLGDGLVFTGATGSNPGDVRAMTDYQSKLYAMGLFNQADGKSTPGLAVWDGSDWDAVGEGINFPGNSMVVWNGKLLMTGFTPSGLGGIVQWDGTTLTEFPDVPVNFVTPTALAVYQGSLVAAYSSGGRSTIVRWNGSSWENFSNPLPVFSGSIKTLLADNQRLYIGGGFNATFNGKQLSKAAFWDGASWQPMGDGLEGSVFADVNAFALAGKGVIATGWFDTSGPVELQKLGYFDGSTWHPLGPGLHNDRVGDVGNALFITNGTVYVGGIFDQAGTVWSENIGAFTLTLDIIYTDGFEGN